MAFNMMSRMNDVKNDFKMREGELTKKIERQTAKIPSSTFLAIALGSMAVSAGLEFFTKRKQAATFIGLWAPTILMMGLYNKLVKVQGHD